MQYIHNLLHQHGNKGVVISLLVLLASLGILYFERGTTNLLGQSELITVLLGAIVIMTYLYVRHFFSVRKLDTSLFYSYPITTLTEIKATSESLGVDSFYIGSLAKMRQDPLWKHIEKNYLYAKSTMTQYHPSLDKYRQPPHLFGAEKVLVVRYKNNLVQCKQIMPITNDLFEVIEFLKPFLQNGVPIHGEYEKLKNAKSQFTTQNWFKIFLLAIAIIIPFIFISVFIAGWQDLPR